MLLSRCSPQLTLYFKVNFDDDLFKDTAYFREKLARIALDYRDKVGTREPTRVLLCAQNKCIMDPSVGQTTVAADATYCHPNWINQSSIGPSLHHQR